MITDKLRVVPSPEAVALGRALVPRGRSLGGIHPNHLFEIYGFLAEENRAFPLLFDRACKMLDLLALPQCGRRFSRLDRSRQQELIRGWNADTGNVGSILSLVASVFKIYYFDLPEFFDFYGISHDKSPQTAEPEPRYMQQAMPGHQWGGDELEAEVLVVGSGASGAIVAKELAERGHAVLLVESGQYFRRHQFTGRFLPASRTFFHWRLRNIVLGSAPIILPTGRTVGGSTTVNTATCFRPPPWVFERWEAMGLPRLAEEHLGRHFEAVEALMQVAPTPREMWGGHVEQMNALLDRLGLSHGPIQRNAPECDGQNSCDFGCPSGGKYSMDQACVPMALRHGALLLTETELARVHIRHRRVRGATLVSGGRTLEVHVPHVVLCGGTMATPELLWQHDLGGPQVGKNLTIQPSASVQARLDRQVNGHGVVVPSSHYIDAFQDRGVMLISANLPLDLGAMPIQLVGDELMSEMEQYQYFGNWGVLLAETTRGCLRRLPGGTVMTWYPMNQADADLLKWGLAKNMELYLEAGARACHPGVRGWANIKNTNDLNMFRESHVKPRDILMTAYHPLGTCIMGTSPGDSVVDPDFAVWGIDGLHVADGSVIPGPLGINSQLTVMAFAHMAAGVLHRKLEE